MRLNTCLYYSDHNPPGCYKNQVCCEGHPYDTQVVPCSCGGDDGGGGNTCDATAPTNLSVSRISPTKAQITWTKGSNGTKQRLFVGANKNEVKDGCPGNASPACVVKG
jgi:hypothetical protein